MRNDTYKTILKQIGSLLVVLGFVEIVPIIISLMYKEWYSTTAFLFSVVITLGSGFALYKSFYHSEEPHYNHYLIIAASGWLGITFMGSLPFFIVAHITPADVMNGFIPEGAEYSYSSLFYFKNPLHCFFESMSAFTTTGLTMAIHEPSVGKGVLFYRSLAQWVGGAGFIVMVLAIFKQTSGRSAILLYGSESTGERLKPRVIETARSIWEVYLFVTLFSAVYLFVGTRLILPQYPIAETVFDAVNHAMTGQSTGGFSTLDDSIAGYGSLQMEMLYLLPMILGAFSIPFYFKLIFKRKWDEIWHDIQTRSLIIAYFVGSIILSLLLLNANIVPNPVREGIFQFISAMSTTGWQTSNIANWDVLSVVFIIGTAMFVGGASGATVGGIKMVRALMIKKGVIWQINKIFLSEHAIKKIKFNGKSMLPAEINEEFTKAASLAFLYFLLIISSTVLTFLITNREFSIFDILFESASAQGTVGLSSGITDPNMSPYVELIYIFQMWTGRLEIIPVFALVKVLFTGMD